ncbi:MAG: D-alanyl-D-alanine carboxypeptidase [Deltaproteobacteria bacterium]|nr:D-alanyl-D-alanine carboxypeptidase [Deltaproteobacteria bacterium]
MDEDTGEVLTARDAELPRPVASISKLAAMLVWADAGVPDDHVVTITREIKEHMQITRSKLRVRGQYRAGDLLYSALLSSDNRAAAGLAFATGLPNEAFAAAMTRRAHRIGLSTATFGDPTGLHPDNMASPRDAARLLAASLDHPVLGPVLNTIEHQYSRQDRSVLIAARNSNLLAHYDHWRTFGGKTGYTLVAGSCLVQRVEIAGRRLLVALLGARRPDDRYEEMVRLRNWIEENMPGGAGLEDRD